MFSHQPWAFGFGVRLRPPTEAGGRALLGPTRAPLWGGAPSWRPLTSFCPVPAPLIDKQGVGLLSILLPFTLISPGLSAASINLLRPAAGPLPDPVCQARSWGFCDLNTTCHLCSRLFSAPWESSCTGDSPKGTLHSKVSCSGVRQRNSPLPGLLPTERSGLGVTGAPGQLSWVSVHKENEEERGITGRGEGTCHAQQRRIVATRNSNQKTLKLF